MTCNSFRTRNSRLNCKPLPILAALLFSGSIALAQATPPAPAAAPAPPVAPVERRPPGGPGGRPDMQGRPGMHGGPSKFSHSSGMRYGDGRDGFRGGMSSGFRIAPPGMWWKNPTIVQKLTLAPDQVKKMDDIFQASRLRLVDLKANVERQNLMLEPMLSANPPDTVKTLAQIDKVAQARADLEKENARMLLGIRGVLTPDQWTKLRASGPEVSGRPGPPNGGGAGQAGGYGGGGYGGGRGPRGPGGPAPGGNIIAPEPQF